MKKVLWLASWYPNKRAPFSGDFIQRQAEAVALFQPIKVLFVGKSPETPAQKNELQTESNNLQEYVLYYQSSDRFLSRVNSLFIYMRKHLSVFSQLRKNREMPDLIHVQVAMKAGLVALYLKWRYRIPYILSEHWSGYYPQSADNLFGKSILEQFLTKRILKNATRILPVSNALGNQISKHWVQSPFQKIPNVVNTRFFYPANETPVTFRFIHVSNLRFPKNPERILQVFAELLKSGFDAELIVIGPISTQLKELIHSLTLPTDKIQYTGEIPYKAVGAEIRKSSALVMFSFYENMPCVILEALCAGIPVIASRVGGIPEVISQENGLLVEPGNEIELLEAMKNIIKNYHAFNKEKISHAATEQFSYEAIGKEIVAIYDSVLRKS